MESFGFKEWSAVCEALGSGRQSVILRKGGIAEGRDGFSFKHAEFFLFPTWFHEQPQKVRDAGLVLPQSDSSVVEIKFWAKLELSKTITSLNIVERVEPLHVLKREVVSERFGYDEAPGLHIAFVRIFRLNPIWTFPNEKRYGGCRSWVQLPAPPTDLKFEPVLSDSDHDKRRNEFLRIIEGAPNL